MDMSLKKQLIGNHIKVIDYEIDPETKKFKDKEIIVKVINFIKDDTIAIVENEAKYSEELIAGCGIKLEFTFPEKLGVAIKDNKVCHRGTFQTLVVENTKKFTEALTKAYEELEKKEKLLYVFRHYGPVNKPVFLSSILIGVVHTVEEANTVIQKDTKTYVNEANEFDSRPQKYTYSISSGITKYVSPK